MSHAALQLNYERIPFPVFKYRKPPIRWETFAEMIQRPENSEKSYELIEGQIVLMAGGASWNHQIIAGYINAAIWNHLKGSKCQVVQDTNVYLKDNDGDCHNVFQPDIMVGCDKENMTPRGYEGVPLLVVEIISPSTHKNDYFTKCRIYLEFGVQEYLIVDEKANKITVYQQPLEEDDGGMRVETYTFQDTVPIGVLPGLSINFNEVLAVLK